MASNTQSSDISTEQEFAYGQKSMNWYGFGSPVGLGFLLVSAGICAVLVRIAITGL